MVKIAAGRVDSLLGGPGPGTPVLLIYGADSGLVRERADRAVSAVIGADDDPFLSITLPASDLAKDPARLADEMAAQSLIGGRRAIRVRAAADSLTAALKPILEDPGADPNLLVLEAGELTPRSSLRKLCEASKSAAAIACYPPDQEAVADLIRALLSEAGIAISRDAEAYLADSLAADRALVRRETEKLIAFAGDGGSIDLEAAEACIGDSAERSLDDLVMAAGDGDAATVDGAAQRLFSEGMSPVAMLRAAQRHFGRLHLANCRVAAGDRPDNVMASLRPPVFFKAKPRFRRQLDGWRRDRLQEVLGRLADAEAECKRTGMPADTICARTLLQVASLARRRR